MAATRTADALIIGAGVIGAAIAYHLVRRGLRRVMILEQSAGPARGSTGASSACLRQRYTFDDVSRMAKEGLEAMRDLGGYLELKAARSGFVRTGVLWLTRDSEAALRNDHERLARLGIRADIVDAPQVRGLFPALSLCQETFDLSGTAEHDCRPGRRFLFEPDGGYADPVATTESFLAAVKSRGGEVLFGERVIRVLSQGGRISGAVTAGGVQVETPVLVNAAGPWCNTLNRLAGIELPWRLSPTRIQVCVRDYPASVPQPLPMFADASTGIYGRPEALGRQILYGSILPEDETEEVADPDDFDTAADPGFREEKSHALHHRLPGLGTRGELRGYSGLYTINRQDMHPVVGATELGGYYVANGCSGHGFKLAPSIGSMLAQMITGVRKTGDTEAPLDLFAPRRQPFRLATKCVLA